MIKAHGYRYPRSTARRLGPRGIARRRDGGYRGCGGRNAYSVRAAAGWWNGFKPVVAAVLIVAVAVAVGLGLSSQAALIAAKGYRIEGLKRTVTAAEREIGDLRAETATLTSLDRVEEAAGQLGLVEPGQVRLVYAAPVAAPPADSGRLAVDGGGADSGLVADSAATAGGERGLLRALFAGVGRWLLAGAAEAGDR